MLASFSEFKFFQSFRLPVEKADNLRFLVEKENDLGKPIYIDDANLVDISVSGLGFSTMERLNVGTEVTMTLQFKRNHIELDGRVVRAFCDSTSDEKIIYGIEIESDKRLAKLLEQFVLSFSPDRLKDCLIDSALKERYTKASDGFEMFSLLLSLFKDITHFGDKEGFLDNMLEEVVRILNAQRATIFLINPETNELEAVTALGIPKDQLKFDYRLGIAGSVFTTGVALNIDTHNDNSRFNEFFDKKFNFETKSIICHPIHNREDKIIGVIEVLNKRNQDRFSVEDEKTMKVLALVFSSVFHNYNPMSESSQIRRFSTPFDRAFALIGNTAHMRSLRSSILKIKDIDTPVHIHGEPGVGKSLYAKILHYEGQRGLKNNEEIDCAHPDIGAIEEALWSKDESKNKLAQCQAGTVVFKNIDSLSLEHQQRLHKTLVERGLEQGNMTFDIRIVSTSSENLGALVDKGEFDRSFYLFLTKALIQIESLRRRIDDTESLVDYFLKIECKKNGLLLKVLSESALVKLREYDWPGNIRELRTCIERAVMYNPKVHIISDVDFENSAVPLFDATARQRQFGSLPHVSDYHISLKDRLAIVEREMILSEVKRHNGNKSKAAKEMGISREALRKKLLFAESVVVRLDSEEEDVKKAA